MSMPFNPAAQQGQFRELGGGYEAAVAAARQQQQMQPPPQLQLDPQQQMQQIQSQLPMQQQFQQQFQQPQAGQMQLPPQMQQQVPAGQRFGDPYRGQFQNMEQLRAAQAAAQMQQQPQQQFQAQAGLDLNTRLSGPNVPADLQGRTLGEAIAIHNGMRQVHLQMMNQPQGQQFPQAAPQQAAPAAAQQAQPNGWDWKDPAKSVSGIVEDKLNGFAQRMEGMLAPMVQANGMNQMQQAIAQAKAEIGPAFTQYEPLIMQSLQNADPRFLTSPGTWKVAAERVIGAVTLQQARAGQQQPGLFPQQQVPPGQQPMPNLNSFFSEQPGQGGQGAQGAQQLSQAQRQAAQAMGMTEADYAAYYAVTAPRPVQMGGFGR